MKLAEEPIFGETASAKEVIAQGVLHRWCPDIRQSPGGNRCGELRDAEAAKLHESLVPSLPLSPEIHSLFSVNPGFQVFEHARFRPLELSPLAHLPAG
ncbi:hypothetical protein RX330_11850 [Bradyrhizobium sp. NDS-1]|uniref:hypothetical protein n=1 Tax=Bradyrhizobium sp. NDS-1 TaxID=3080014 RepID=UPI00293E31E5|nr:hypothetical protein [Bradyrhizobium sp. NDS-1]WOH75716.1 hypothetical protein RX330_11850 [Bradyrhizobium sp. NDS-1]